MRYRLRTLLIASAIAPPILAPALFFIWTTREVWPLAMLIASVVVVFSVIAGFVVASGIQLLTALANRRK